MRYLRPTTAQQEAFQRMERPKGISSVLQVCAEMTLGQAGPVRPSFENRSSPWWCCGRPRVRSAACRGPVEEASRPFPPAAPISTPALHEHATHPYVNSTHVRLSQPQWRRQLLRQRQWQPPQPQSQPLRRRRGGQRLVNDKGRPRKRSRPFSCRPLPAGEGGTRREAPGG